MTVYRLFLLLSLVGFLIADPDHEVIDLQELLQKVEKSLNAIGEQCHRNVVPRDCADVYMLGKKSSGIYEVLPRGLEDYGSFPVYCDMDTDDGGWLMIQRRGDFGLPVDYFQKTWDEYRNGFGNLSTEFWLGNDRLAFMTSSRPYELRVDLTRHNGEKRFAKYSTFKVDDVSDSFRITIAGFSGNAGDSFAFHSDMMFTTMDRDNDRWPNNCAVDNCNGGWWYKDCHHSNLNGLNWKGGHSKMHTAVNWKHWTGYDESLYSEMKIRPRPLTSK